MVLVCNGAAYAAVDPGMDRKSQPIKIKSNELSTDNNKRSATFTGNVTARQGDLTITAETLIISYSADNRDVEKAEAIGNVRIFQGNRQGQAGHAIYDNIGGKIILDGSPRVIQDNNVVTGKVITYFLNEQKSVVTGGDGVRAEAVIQPGKKGKDDGSKP
jgi:lipopolysaccharide export system protein LptA